MGQRPRCGFVHRHSTAAAMHDFLHLMRCPSKPPINNNCVTANSTWAIGEQFQRTEATMATRQGQMTPPAVKQPVQTRDFR